MIFVTQKKSVYVDSVAGSDANDGLTATTPKATCAAGMTVLASSGRKTIRLKCGSFFREQINLPAGKRLKNYGSGERPILDPRDVAPTSWTLTESRTFTYQQTLPHNLIAPSFHRIWENGVRLLRATSVANCEATVGSFYAATPSGTSQVLYVHPSDDSNPNSNGKEYKYSRRMYGCDMGSGCVYDGVDTGWQAGSDGAIRALAHNCVIRNAKVTDGRKHHVLLAEGLCENVEAYDAEPTVGVGSQIAFIAYNDFTTGRAIGCTFRNCKVDYVTYTPTASVGFYGHGGDGVDKVVLEGCEVKNTALAYGQIIAESIILSRCVAVDCGGFAKAEQTGSAWYLHRCRQVTGPAKRSALFVQASTVAATFYIRHSEMASYSSVSMSIIVNGAGLDMRYCQVTPAAGGTWSTITANKDGPILIQNCIVWSRGNGIYVKSDAIDITADNNLYYCDTNPTGSGTWATGGTSWNYSAWKTNTGQDEHSVIGSPVYTALATETAFSTFAADCPVYTSGFPVGVQPTDDAETLALLASVGYTP